VFAFGIGGAAAIFGGLLHMLVHTLIKSALFQALMRAASLRGSAAPGNYGFSHLRGMIHSNRYVGWLLGGCVFALTGLPPSGLFASEFIIISQTIQRDPYMSLPFGLGLVLCAVAIIRNIGPLVFGHAPPHTKPQKAGIGINLAGLQLVVAFCIAFTMPWFLLHSLSSVAAALQ
jgi:hydrogenase-4 component F